MTQRRLLSLLCLPLLALLGACPRQDNDRDSGPEPDAALDTGGFGCGTPEGLDDMPEFVGSCMGVPDSSGDRGCMEVTTRPNAPGIGTDCMRAGCLAEGNSWIDGHCGGDFMYCRELRLDEGVFYAFYVTNPASCPAM